MQLSRPGLRGLGAPAASLLAGAKAARRLAWARVVAEAARVGVWIYVSILLAVFVFVSLFSTLGLAGPGEGLLDLWVSLVGTVGAWAAFCALVSAGAQRVVLRAGELPGLHGVAVGAVSAAAAWGVINYKYGDPEVWELCLLFGLGLVAGPRGGLRGFREHQKEESVLRAGEDIGAAREPQEIAAAIGAHLKDGEVVATSLWLAEHADGEDAADRAPADTELRLGGSWAARGADGRPVRRYLEPRRAPALAEALEEPEAREDTAGFVLDPGELPIGCWPVGEPAPSTILAIALRHPDARPDLLIIALRLRRRRLGKASLRRYRQIAAHAATRLGALRLMEKGRDEGGTAERDRMQHELHDSIIQGLISAKYVLDGAEGGAAEAQARKAAGIVEELRAEVRRVVAALRTPALKNGLRPALEGVARSLQRDVGAAVEAEVVGDERELPHRLEAAIYWIAHEAAQNIRKHAAGASRAKITLTYLPEGVALDVRDDGPGFEPGTPRRADDPLSANGTGLRAWSESVGRMGGKLEVESASGAGTTLTATLPTGRPPARPVGERRAS